MLAQSIRRIVMFCPHSSIKKLPECVFYWLFVLHVLCVALGLTVPLVAYSSPLASPPLGLPPELPLIVPRVIYVPHFLRIKQEPLNA